MLNLTNREMFDAMYSMALDCQYRPLWRDDTGGYKQIFSHLVGDQSLSIMAEASAIYRCKDPDGRKLVIIPASSTSHPGHGNVVIYEKFPAPLDGNTTMLVVQAHISYILPRTSRRHQENLAWKPGLEVDSLALALMTDDHVDLNALLTTYSTLALLEKGAQATSVRTSEETEALKLKDLVDKYFPLWQSHKQVRAVKIHKLVPQPGGHVVGHAEEPKVPSFVLTAEFIKRHKPEVGGYIVAYNDGYLSYSPAVAFEEGYTRIGGDQ